MTICYVVGGGLGHLTRTRAALHTLGWDQNDYVVITNHPDANLVFDDSQLAPLTNAEMANTDRLHLRLSQLTEHATRFVIDCFPLGVTGELTGWSSTIPTSLIARAMNWPTYRKQAPGNLPQFATAFLTESLDTQHLTDLEATSDQLNQLTLRDPPIEQTRWSSAPYAIVCHSGSAEEVSQLLNYAVDTLKYTKSTAQLVVVTPQKPADLPSGAEWARIYPALQFFEHAEWIFSGAGFNTIRQCAPYSEKHRAIPFNRRFDNQFSRNKKP